MNITPPQVIPLIRVNDRIVRPALPTREIAAGQLLAFIRDKKGALTTINDQNIQPLAEETARVLTDQARDLSWHEDNFIISVLQASMAFYHPQTARHQNQVAVLAVQIGARLGFSADSIHPLTLAALLHDIGKLIVPTTLLDNGGSLVPGDNELVKKGHLLYGYYLLEAISFLREAATIVAYNHVYDGYAPAGISLDYENVPIEAQVLSAADTIEALSDPSRSYLHDGRQISLNQVITRRKYNPELLEAVRSLRPGII
jgi:HD-GYP domain-containing protein (c-di-GMP phosphodiesterase class II)